MKGVSKIFKSGGYKLARSFGGSSSSGAGGGAGGDPPSLTDMELELARLEVEAERLKEICENNNAGEGDKDYVAWINATTEAADLRARKTKLENDQDKASALVEAAEEAAATAESGGDGGRSGGATSNK